MCVIYSKSHRYKKNQNNKLFRSKIKWAKKFSFFRSGPNWKSRIASWSRIIKFTLIKKISIFFKSSYFILKKLGSSKTSNLRHSHFNLKILVSIFKWNKQDSTPYLKILTWVGVYFLFFIISLEKLVWIKYHVITHTTFKYLY